MMEVLKDREVWRLNLKLLLRNPQKKAGNEERKRPMLQYECKKSPPIYLHFSNKRLNCLLVLDPNWDIWCFIPKEKNG